MIAMLKQERLNKIVDIIDHDGVATVSGLAKTIGVSEMTIRRDFNELDRTGRVLRVHGGAQSIAKSQAIEKNFNEKREIHVNEKVEVAEKAAKLPKDGQTIYIGPGTTLEFMTAKLTQKNLRIVTNSIPVFEVAKDNPNGYDLILIGGSYRRTSGACIGALANTDLRSMGYDCAFVDINGIVKNYMMTANMEEGLTEKIALDRAVHKYVVCDKYKFNKNDFFNFYKLSDIDCLITNPSVPKKMISYYGQFTKIDNS